MKTFAYLPNTGDRFHSWYQCRHYQQISQNLSSIAVSTLILFIGDTGIWVWWEGQHWIFLWAHWSSFHWQSYRFHCVYVWCSCIGGIHWNSIIRTFSWCKTLQFCDHVNILTSYNIFINLFKLGDYFIWLFQDWLINDHRASWWDFKVMLELETQLGCLLPIFL